MKRIILLIIAAMLAATGCGGGKDVDGEAGEPLVYVVDLCYINDEYLAAEDEAMSAFHYYRSVLIYAPEGEQYYVLLNETLRDNPLGIESFCTMITDKVKFNSVKVQDGTAFVDISGENLSGSSLEEGLLISQIVYSLTGSFEEVERVQFMVDGETPETLMGHYDATEPFETGIYPL